MAIEKLYARNEIFSIYLFQRNGCRENGLKGGEKGDYGRSHRNNEGGWDKDCSSGEVRSEWILQATWRWRLVGHVDGLDVVCESKMTRRFLT